MMCAAGAPAKKDEPYGGPPFVIIFRCDMLLHKVDVQVSKSLYFQQILKIDYVLPNSADIAKVCRWGAKFQKRSAPAPLQNIVNILM
jgi:hypothetical protein